VQAGEIRTRTVLLCASSESNKNVVCLETVDFVAGSTEKRETLSLSGNFVYVWWQSGDKVGVIDGFRVEETLVK
jgi:hypothetical protein